MATRQTVVKAQATPPVVEGPIEACPPVVPVRLHRPVVLRVTLAGVGGTGARLVGPLSQLLTSTDTLSIYDPDTVESINLVRQHFGPRDLGEPKAAVVARRYQRDQGPKIEGYVAPLTYGEIAQAPWPLLITCVDTRATRAEVWEFLQSSIAPPRWIWIDAGNEVTMGQVVLSACWSIMVGEVEGRVLSERSIDVPTILQVAPDLVDPTIQAAQKVQCEEAVENGQTLAANAMAAALVVSLLEPILMGRPFTAWGARFALQGPTVKAWSLRSMVQDPSSTRYLGHVA